MVITKRQALKLLNKDMELARQAVARNVHVALSPKQHHALVSFAFNVGAGAFKRSSVVRHINNGRGIEAAKALLLYTHDSYGRKLEGLVNRRLQEAVWLIG